MLNAMDIVMSTAGGQPGFKELTFLGLSIAQQSKQLTWLDQDSQANQMRRDYVSKPARQLFKTDGVSTFR